MSKNRGEVLIALLKAKSDLTILRDQSWYRIPVSKRKITGWPPKWLAFYQPKAFGQDAYRVRYYGEVAHIQVVYRHELFPNELPNPKTNRQYYKISLKNLRQRHPPIPSHRPRRLLFIPTTWYKFIHADQINDLFHQSPLEDRMWAELKRQKIRAERLWKLNVEKARYYLDFAVFCQDGCIDIEADGDTWHARKDRIPKDNRRNNDLASIGWHVLRFNGHEIREKIQDYCLGQIYKTINRLGGLSDEGLVPRKFHRYQRKTVQQLSMFESSANYTIDTGAKYNLETDSNLEDSKPTTGEV